MSAADRSSSTKKFDTPRDVYAETPAKVTTRVHGATDALHRAIHVEETVDEESLLDIKIHNPLKRITQILQDIKHHQTTTVSLRFTIPLIALPIVLFVVFQIGRAQSLCAQSFVTQQGRLQMLSVKEPVKQQGALALVLSFFPSVPKVVDPSSLKSHSRTILTTPVNEVIHVLHHSDTDVSSYVGQAVLLTGNYSACTRSMTLDDLSNLTEATLE